MPLAAKCFEVLDLLDGRPPFRRDALVVLDGRHAALTIVLPAGCKGKQALRLNRKGRRLLLGRLFVLQDDGRRIHEQVLGEPVESRAALALEAAPDGAQHVECHRFDVARALQDGEHMHLAAIEARNVDGVALPCAARQDARELDQRVANVKHPGLFGT